jgi:O-antigen/teichoic acid export membrane protein
MRIKIQRPTRDLALPLLGVTSFDAATPELRSKKRYKRVAANAVSSLAAKGVLAATMLLSVPITLRYVGDERFGLWATLMSLISFLVLSDLGIGNALVNLVARSDGRDDRDGAVIAVSSAFFMLLLLSALVLGSFAVAYSYVDWAALFGLHTELAQAEAGPAAAVLVAVVALQLFIGIVQRVQDGYQESYKTNLWQVAGYLLGLAGLVLVVNLDLGVPWVVLALAGAPLATTFANSCQQFGRGRPWLRPRWSAVRPEVARNLLGSGLIFFALSALTFVGLQSDSLIVSYVLGSAAVTEYAVVQRLSLIAYVFQAPILALWPAYGEAIARGEYRWVRRAFMRSLVMTLTSAVVLAIALFLFGLALIRMWVGPAVVPAPGLLYGFCALILILPLISNIATILNAGPLLTRQLWILGIAAPVALVLKVVFTREFGVAGAIWATVIAFSLFYITPGLFLIKSLLSAPDHFVESS